MTSNYQSMHFVLRSLGLITVLIFGAISILGTNGSDEGDGNGESSVSLLSLYDLTINRGVDESGTESSGIDLVAVSGPQNSSPRITLRVDPHPVLGSFQCDPETDECGLATIDTGTFLDVYDESPSLIVGNLNIQILDQVIIGVSGQPVLGRIQVQSVAAPDGLDEGFIQVEMATCAGGAGVNIYDNGTLKGCYTWDVFEQLFDNSTDPVEQLAAFGFQVFEFLFEQVDFVTEILGVIDENAANLQQAGTINEMCDAFSDAGLSAPGNVMGRSVPDQGMRSLTWMDSNSNGSVGPGDSFVGILDECWINDPADDVDELLDGTGSYYGYVESVDTARQVITAIGFTSSAPSNPGGVFYTGFSISETEETSPGTAAITNWITMGGGISVMFIEPQQ